MKYFIGAIAIFILGAIPNVAIIGYQYIYPPAVESYSPYPYPIVLHDGCVQVDYDCKNL